ncbi:Nucleic acid-binding, OB-fold [Sesbania bispinosa]|nr:Nucleic acid-binding, OB-fold [Sesbania bispinosa]
MASSQPNREIKVQDIANGIGYWFIKVKVLRMWPQLDSSRDYEMLSLELVLMDSEGTKIQGTIPVDVFNSTDFDIAEEGYYKIGRVQVVNNDGQQRATAHPFRLFFSHRSLVRPWQPRSFSNSYGLTPLAVAQIRTYKNELEQFVDIVGLCISISSERVDFLDGRVVNMVLLEITDETGSLECVLYDQYVDQIHGHIKINGMRRTVVVVQFTKMVPFDATLFGDCVIQIIPNVTRLLFNPPIDEVFEVYDRLHKHGIDLISPLRKELCELCFQAKVGLRFYVILYFKLSFLVREDGTLY